VEGLCVVVGKRAVVGAGANGGLHAVADDRRVLQVVGDDWFRTGHVLGIDSRAESGYTINIFRETGAGALVDRWSRRTIMIVADTAIALATLVLVPAFAGTERCSGVEYLHERRTGNGSVGIADRRSIRRCLWSKAVDIVEKSCREAANLYD